MTAYTNSLRLTLPVTGTDDGTWGDTVNTGITALVDSAVAGTATVAHDDTANYTLTDNDGAADEARQMFLNITGTLTAARNVVCPGVSKLYFLTNNTTGGYAVTLKTSGGTGISVANGKSAALYCNGTNVVYAFDQVTLQPTVSITGNMDNGTTDYAVTATPTIKDNVTGSAAIYGATPATATGDTWATPLTSLFNFFASQGTFKASSVKSQAGFYANSTLTGAQYNYGFYGGIATKSTVTISSVNGTGSTVTVDTATSHGLADNDYVFINLVPQTTMTSGSYNGYYQVTVVDSNTFTYSSSATSSAPVTSGYATPSGQWNLFMNGTGQNYLGGSTIISANSYVDALRITQTGSGNAFIVEDSTNPDSTPFVIDAGGYIGTGSTTFQQVPLSSSTLGTPRIQIQYNLQGESSVLQAAYNTTSTVAPNLVLARSRGTSIGEQALVSSGDSLGRIVFEGSDGQETGVNAGFIRAAQIEAQVDGTPGAADMPGRLVFSTTADGASSPTERMRIGSDGGIAIGTTVTLAYVINAGKDITGATTSYGAVMSGTVQSGVTSTAQYFRTTAKTAAAAFTLGTLSHYVADQGTIGAGSAVTTQAGFVANSSLTGATNNYGFYGNIASGTGRYNFYAAGTADNYFAGNVGIGTSSPLVKTQIDIGATSGEALRLSCATDASTQQTVSLGFSTSTAQTNPAALIEMLEFDASDSRADLLFYTRGANSDSAPTERMRISSSGYVGIGTSSPGYPLSVYSSTGTAMTVATTGVSNSQLLCSDASNNVAYLSLYRDSASPANSDNLFALRFNGNNSAASSIEYARIGTAALNVASGSEAGRMLFYVYSAASGGITAKLDIRDNITFAAGFNDTTTASAANLFINSTTAQVSRSTSSARYKTDVEDIQDQYISNISKLRPIWYRSLSSSDNAGWSWYGLIAEEVAQVEPRLVHWRYAEDQFDEVDVVDVEGEAPRKEKVLKEGAVQTPDGVQYERLTVLLLAEVQKLRKELDALKAA